MINYIAYRVFVHFDRSDKSLSRFKTIGFVTLFQISTVVPIFLLVNMFKRIELQLLIEEVAFKLSIGVMLFLLMAVNGLLFTRKLKGVKLVAMREKYHRDRYIIPIWVIFTAPVFFVFICPIVYGIINGSIHIAAPQK